MTLPSPVHEPKNNTKAIIIVAIVFSIITIIALATVAVLFLSAPAIDNSGSKDDASISQEQVPLVTDFTVKQTEGSNATYSFTLDKIPDGYYLEYKVEDNMLKVLNDGVVRKPGFVEDKVLLKSGTESVYLMLRVTDGNVYSRWVTAGSVPVTTEGSAKTERSVSESFYSTGWAQKTDSSVEALADALHKAFNIKVFTDQYAQELQGCYWGNKAEVVAGEIIRPQPDLGDKEYKLKASVYQKDATIFEITYFWCQ